MTVAYLRCPRHIQLYACSMLLSQSEIFPPVILHLYQENIFNLIFYKEYYGKIVKYVCISFELFSIIVKIGYVGLKKICVSGNRPKKLSRQLNIIFYFMKKSELSFTVRKTSGRKVVEAENFPQKFFRSGVFCLGGTGCRKHTIFFFLP